MPRNKLPLILALLLLASAAPLASAHEHGGGPPEEPCEPACVPVECLPAEGTEAWVPRPECLLAP